MRAATQVRPLALLGFAIGALAGCAAAITAAPHPDLVPLPRTADGKDRVAESDERNNTAAGICRN